jgi:hypothetical protein
MLVTVRLRFGIFGKLAVLRRVLLIWLELALQFVMLAIGQVSLVPLGIALSLQPLLRHLHSPLVYPY